MRQQKRIVTWFENVFTLSLIGIGSAGLLALMIPNAISLILLFINAFAIGRLVGRADYWKDCYDNLKEFNR